MEPAATPINKKKVFYSSSEASVIVNNRPIQDHLHWTIKLHPSTQVHLNEDVLILKHPLTLLLWVDTSATHAVYKTGPLNHVRSIVYGKHLTFHLPFLKSSTPANIWQGSNKNSTGANIQ